MNCLCYITDNNIKVEILGGKESLTKLTFNKVSFKYTEVKHEAFKEIKRIVASNISLAYPDFNKKRNP